MPTVTFVDPNGGRHIAEDSGQLTLMQVALDHNVPGILGDCGGACSCATCHGIVDAEWVPKLPAPSETETFMLESVTHREAGSRLCCQIRLNAALDGMVIHLPEEQA